MHNHQVKKDVKDSAQNESTDYSQALTKANKLLSETVPLLLRHPTYILSNHELALMTQIWIISKELKVEDQLKLFEEIIKTTPLDKQRVQNIIDGAIQLGYVSSVELLKACGKFPVEKPSKSLSPLLTDKERHDLLNTTKKLEAELLEIESNQPNIMDKAREVFSKPRTDVPKTDEDRKHARIQRAVALLILDGDEKYRLKAKKFQWHKRYLGSPDSFYTYEPDQESVNARSDFLKQIVQQVPDIWQIAVMEALVNTIPCDPFGLMGPVEDMKEEMKEYKNPTTDEFNWQLLEKFNLAKSGKDPVKPGEPLNRDQCLAIMINNAFSFETTRYRDKLVNKPRVENTLNYTICVLCITSDGKEHSALLKKGESTELLPNIKSIRAISEPDNNGCSKEVYLNPNFPNPFSMVLKVSEKEELVEPFMGQEELFHKESPFLHGEQLRLKGPSDDKKINPFIHFYWHGRYLSDEQLDRVETWIVDNPETTVVIWTDMEENDNSEDAKRIKARCAKIGVKLCNFSQVMNNDEVLDNVLKRLGLDRIYKSYLLKPNFGAASDVARTAALFIFGGIYADMDRTCYLPFYFYRQAYQFVFQTSGTNDFIMSRRAHSTSDPHPINEYIRNIRNKHLYPAMKNSRTWIPRFRFSEEDEVVIQMTGPDAFNMAVATYRGSTADQGGVVAIREEHIGQIQSKTIFSYAHGKNLIEWTTSKDTSAIILDAKSNKTQRLTTQRLKELCTSMLGDWYNFGFLNRERYKHTLMREGAQPDLSFMFIEGVLDYYTPAARALHDARSAILLPSNLQPRTSLLEEESITNESRLKLIIKLHQIEQILEDLKNAKKQSKPMDMIIDEIGWRLFSIFAECDLSACKMTKKDEDRLRQGLRPDDENLKRHYLFFCNTAIEAHDLARICWRNKKPTLDEVEKQLSSIIKQCKS